VWAVGTRDYEQGPLIMHWNGIQWSVASLNTKELLAGGGAVAQSPHSIDAPDPYATHLQGVTAIAPNNIWAVGTFRISNSNQTLIMHYNGTNWSIAGSPSVGGYMNQLTGVDAIAANDIWAVGYYRNFYAEPSRTLTLH